MNNLTTFKECLPANLKLLVSDEFSQMVDNLESDPTIKDHIEKNMISYSSVLNNGNYTLESYLHAIAYVTHRLMDNSKVMSYAKAFPNKYANLVASGAPASVINKYATSYENTKLVSSVMEQSIVPTWILNQDIYQQAINTQANLMLTANSEKVRCDAANSLLTHLARPKEVTPMIAIGIGNNSELDILKKSMVDLANNQRDRILSGESTKNIADEDIVNGNYQ